MVRNDNHGGESPDDSKPGAAPGEHRDGTESTVGGPVSGSDVPRFGDFGDELDRVHAEAAQVEDDTPEEPVDLSAVQADDALLSLLGSPEAAVDDDAADAELQALLLSWREEADADPLPELVDVEGAVAAIELAKRRSQKRRWHLTPVSAAAAVLVVAFVGMGLAAKDAQPGDTLWGVTQVLYSDHAKSVTAAVEARKALTSAQVAIEDGNLNAAKAALQRAQSTLKSVAPEDGHDQLVAIHTTLSKQLSGGGTPTTGPSTSSTSSASSSPSTSAPPSSSSPSPSSSVSPTPSPSGSTSPSRPSPSASSSTPPPKPSEPSSSLFPSSPFPINGPSGERPGSPSSN